MAGLELRKAGTTADRAPVIKRGLVTLTDGRVVALAIDANLASSSGTDVTGVAKIYLHLSTTSDRTAFTQAIAYTPPTPPCSSTFQAVASMGAGANNSIWVVWQGTDSSLYMSRWTYSAGVFTFVSTTTVQATGGITNRFRKVDIDVTGNATPIIAAYEAKTSGGAGAWHNTYCLMNDGVTWRRMQQFNALASAQILENSEDISIAVRGDGVVSNVVRYLMYGTRSYTTGDLGDELIECSFNVSTGTTDSATQLGAWFTDLNKTQAVGTRRGFIYTLTSTVWLFAGVVGTSVPKFFATKLTSGNWAPPAITSVGYVASVALSNFFKIEPSYNQKLAVGTTYRDNRLVFAFASVGSGQAPRIAREIVFAYGTVAAVNIAPTVDSVPRPLDSNFYGAVSSITPGGGPIALYGGDNRRLDLALKTFNFTVLYGVPGDTVGTTFFRTWRYVGEDTFDAPFLMAPKSLEAVPNNFPTFRVRVENLSMTPNLYGKIHVQVSEDFTFTVGNIDIIQPDSALQYFGSKDGLSSSSKEVSVKTPAGQPLHSGLWYWRARIVSDKDTPGIWSLDTTLNIYHPPIAVPVSPASNQVVLQSGGNVAFDWSMSDTEATDTQAKYQLIIKRTDTGATVLDTGVVSSSVTSATIAVSGTYLDVPLSWSVQLTDSGPFGSVGPWSGPTNFTMTTAPVVAITSPADLSTVTTAAPTVSWTFTPVGGRAQRAYRVRIDKDFNTNAIANNSFEVNTTGWTATGNTFARDASFAHLGSWSGKMTPDGVTANPRVAQVYTAGLACQANVTVIVKGWIRPTNAAKNVEIGIDWYNLAGSYLSSTVVAAPATALAWQELQMTATAPATTAYAAARIGMLSTPAAGDVAYVDQLSIAFAVIQQSPSVGDSGWQTSALTSYSFNSNVLEEGVNYRIRVDVQDEGGITVYDDVQVITDWVEPQLATISVTDDIYKVSVSWTNAQQDADFVAWRVYRRYMVTSVAELDVTNTRNTWVLIHEDYEASASFTYLDYTAPIGIPTDYVVVQLADRFGSLVESNITTYTTVVQDGDRYFFVPEIAVGTIVSFEAAEVVGDQFTREIEQETLHVVGRGRQVQIGEDLGYIGSLSLHLRNPSTARMVREFFEILSADNNKVYIKSPFGDVVLAAIGNIPTTRQPGYGAADIADITVPYSEVFAEEQVTRISVEP